MGMVEILLWKEITNFPLRISKLSHRDTEQYISIPALDSLRSQKFNDPQMTFDRTTVGFKCITVGIYESMWTQ